MLFLEASDDILVRRYEQNRRSHPLQGNQTLAEGIAAERTMLAPVRAGADLVIDTSTLSVPALRESIERAFGGEAVAHTSVTVESFGYKYGLPMDADTVMDVRFLPNPHWVDELRPHTGQHPAVRDYVLGQPGAARVPRHLPSAAGRRDRRLPPGGEALHDRRHRLHRRQAPQRGDGRGAGRRGCRTATADGAGAAPGSGPRMSRAQSIVALGGGHGLYATLSAARRLTPHVTAVVTVADDGGSSGRLRSELDVVPPGDLRMALAALASDSPHGRLWATIIQHRFGGSGALAGHPIGNLILAGLNEVLADPVAALDELGRMLGVKGRVLPMCPIALQIEADVAGLESDPRMSRVIRGQVAIATTVGQGAPGAAAARRSAGDPAGGRRDHGRRSRGARARVRGSPA